MVGDAVQEHYTRGDLLEVVLRALTDAGLDVDALDPAALEPAEELHLLGRAATVALAERAMITELDRVLDVGAGLGGPARYLAANLGCEVTGIDLTPELCEVAAELTRRVRLTDLVTIRQADALDLPFEDDEFDVAWTQHVSMNVEDKARFYGELRRVVITGGRLAFFDLLAGPNQPIHLPVPWAADRATSFLATPDETRALLDAAGFQVRSWEDLTHEAVGSLRQLSGPPSGLGPHLVVPDMAARAANLRRNVDEGRVVLVRVVADAV
jgi:ubiquinone/menaquinone biosynthesis C-methylase UbiE